jgi:hypothetical protein
MATTNTARITVRLLPDGQEITFVSHTFMCTADRVAFERHFNIGSSVISAQLAKFEDDGTPRPGEDVSDVREAYLLFFLWRAAVRAAPELEGAAFDGGEDAFLERILDFEMEMDDATVHEGEPDGGVADPTQLVHSSS